MFHKSARAVILGALESGGLRHRAQSGSGASAYANGFPSTIDFQNALNLVADAYSISQNPTDYVFCVARAVTAELSPDQPAPNENGDAFPLEELLRFDHRLARRVYKTFDYKPNFINHRADNPKTARGFVVDSTFNRTNPEDQYVECLIAVDGSKDPVYAEGIRTGSIDAFSMGCVAEYTICSVCANKATNRWQFCRHIANHKMKQFDGKLAYERCGGVCYEELSAVDQPADPRALTQEVLAIQAQIAERQQLGTESEILVLKSRLAKLEHELASKKEPEMTSLDKTAQAQPLPAPPAPTPVTAQPEGLPKPKVPRDPEDDLIMAQEEPEMLPFAGDADMPIAEDDELMPEAGGIEQYKEKKDREDNAPMSDAEIGIMSVSARKLQPRYVKRYAHIRVAATKAGNFRVFDARTGKSIFAVRPPGRLANRKQAMQFCDVLLRHIGHYGLDQTIAKFNGILPPKKSQVLDHQDDNLAEERGKQVPVLDKADDNLENVRDKPAPKATDELDSNKAEEYSAGPSTAIDERVTNAEDADQVSSDALSSTSNPDSNKREEYDEKKIPQMDSLDEEVHNHEERVAKLTSYYQRKIAAIEKAANEKASSLESRVEKLAEKKAADMMKRFERCLHLASERQRLNREESPIKIAIADALLKPFDINDHESWSGCETELTAMLVERGMQDGMPVHVASLITRAKELYTFDDRLLADSEQDLRRAVASPITASASEPRARSSRSAALEARALGGNPVVRTSEQGPEEEDQRRLAIRASVGKPGFARVFDSARELGPLGRSNH